MIETFKMRVHLAKVVHVPDPKNPNGPPIEVKTISIFPTEVSASYYTLGGVRAESK